MLITVDQRDGRHAVTVAGMRLRDGAIPVENDVADRAALLDTVYIHDDRLGPYIPAIIKRVEDPGKKRTLLQLILPEPNEPLTVTHIWVPMHAKVRNAFNELRADSFKLAKAVGAWRQVVRKLKPETPEAVVCMDAWIERGHKYAYHLGRLDKADASTVKRLCSEVVLPRYVGVVRLWTDQDLDRIDVLMDTTSTDRNAHAVAVVVTANTKRETMAIARWLSERYECGLVVPCVT